MLSLRVAFVCLRLMIGCVDLMLDLLLVLCFMVDLLIELVVLVASVEI